jgi:TM2 domain-containing membrane protein YozV
MKCNQCNFINEINEDKCSNCGCDLIDQESFDEDNIVDENVIDTKKTEEKGNNISNKKWGPVLVLCLLLGLIGFHRFYVGKAGTAIFMLLTLGGFGIWTLVDLIIIIIGEFTDEDGKKIKRVKESLVEVE